MGKLIDLTRQRYGMLFVESRAGSSSGNSTWNVLCDCGVRKVLPALAFRSGATKSCGCLRLAGRKISTDFTGQRFGKLVVTGIHKHNVHGEPGVYWDAKCDCGNTVVLHSSNVRVAKGCGCLRRKPDGESARRWVLYSYQRDAEKRELCWQLNDAEFLALTQQDCHYCGIKPKQEFQGYTKQPDGSRRYYNTGVFVYNGIDRKDNKAGYTTENCVPCCGYCNKLKRHYDYQEFIDWLKRAGRYQQELAP
jgi:hypothetical protein